MDDIMSKLQNVLNDEESMNQIKQLAEMFAQGDTENPAPSNSQPDLSALASMLSGGNTTPPPQTQSDSGFDLNKLISLQQIFQKSSVRDKNTELLLALRPLLKKENQAKIDKLIKLFQLMTMLPLLKESGILGGDFLGIL